MKKISESLKKQLRIPLGKLYQSAQDILDVHPRMKIVAVGDQSVLSFLRLGKKPYISVFDFKTLRKRIPKRDVEYLKKSFPNLKTIRNLPSTVSRRILHVAPLFLRNGGALRVFGEEDLIALVFMYFGDSSMIVVYGQPHKGLVVVEPYKNRKMIEELLDKALPNLYD